MTGAASVFNTTEEQMVTLYDHIQQLRAELACCYLASPAERTAIKAELEQALARQAELDRQYEAGGGD